MADSSRAGPESVSVGASRVRNRRLCATALVCGALETIVGACALAGWLAGDARWIRIPADGPSVMFNAALAHVLGGVALVALSAGRCTPAGWLGVATLAVGFVTLVEYACGFDLRVDQLLVTDFLSDPLSNPGRMAPNSATCFVLGGLALWTVSSARSHRGWLMIVALFGAVVATLGANEVFGHVTGIRFARDWNVFVPMALPTAIGFVLLGVGVVAHAWRANEAQSADAVRWAPVLASTALATLGTWIWQALNAREQVNLERIVARDAAHLQSLLVSRFEACLQPHVRHAQRFGAEPELPRDRWRLDAEFAFEREESLCALAWIDASLTARWVDAPPGVAAIEGWFVARDPDVQSLLQAARDRGEAQIGASFLEPHEGAFSVVAPIHSPDSTSGEFQGWLVAELSSATLLADVRSESAIFSQYDVSLLRCARAPECTVCTRSEAAPSWTREVDFDTHGATWHAAIRPFPELLAERQSGLAAVVLAGGLASGVLLSLAMHLAQKAKRREAEVRRASEVLAVEIERRRHAQDALRESEWRLASDTAARMLAVTNSVIDGIITIDENGTIESLNPATLRIFGYDSDSELEGRNVKVLMPEPYHSGHDGYLEAYRRTGVRKIIGIGREVIGRRKDGSVFPIDLSVSVVALGHRRIFTGVVRDISERKRTEEELARSFRDVTRLKEIERMKDELVSTVSHELRTPLTSLRGFAELMLSREFPPEKQRHFLTIIRTESVRLSALISDFLDLQRMESGRQTYDFASVELAPIVHEAASVFRVPEHPHEVRVEISDELPPVWADADRVRQMLSNLISNAIKYSPDGGTVTVAAHLDDGHVHVSVSDEGIGIAPEDVEKLFRRFYRVHNVETRRVGGTGLGLALVKEIAEAHGGRVHVESELGKGSKFTFSLPVAVRATLPSIDARPASEIFLLEDDRSFANLLEEHFAIHGIDVETHTEADGAIDRMRAAPPQLAMLDVHLGGCRDGWDVLIAMKGDPRLRAVPALVISASETINARGLAVAGAEYVVKPVPPSWLLQVVRRRMPPTSTRRVLVADDDPAFRTQVKETLAGEPDLCVVEAANGVEALAQIDAEMPDLLLLDLLMPELDGFEVLRRLRGNRRAMNLSVVVATAKELSRDEKEMIKRRLATLVRKSDTNLDQFVEVVNRMLGRHVGAA